MRLPLVLLPAVALILATGPAAGAAEADELAAPRWVAVGHIERERRVGLRWSPVPGATAYRLWRRLEAEREFSIRETTPAVQYFDDSCAPGDTCRYRLQALAGEAASPFSEESAVSVPAERTVVFKRDAPRWLGSAINAVEDSAGALRLNVALRWTKVPGAIGYQLARRVAGSGASAPLGFFERPEAVDDAVTEGATYVYTVSAVGPDFSDTPPSLERSVPVLRERVDQVTTLAPEYADFDAVKLWSTGGMGSLFDVACDRARNRVYVTATRERSIVQISSADGTVTRRLGPRIGTAELRRPLGIATDGAGTLYVVDQDPPALVVITPEGGLRRRIVLPTRAQAAAPRPIDVAVHRDGRMFVTDAANGQVLVLGANGALLARWGRQGRGAADLLGIAGVAITGKGEVAVVDAAADSVKVFTPEGTFLRAFGALKAGEPALGSVGGALVLPDGRLLAANLWFSELRILGGEPGPRPFRIAVTAGKSEYFPLLGPVGIAGDGKDLLCVTEGVADRVSCLRLLASRAGGR